MTTNHTDPTEIDLETLRPASYKDYLALIDAVRALREQVMKLKANLQNIDGLLARRPAIDNKPSRFQKISHALYTAGLANAAQAHAAELAWALSELMRWHRNEGADTDEPPGAFLRKGSTALATIPTQALERARAKDAVVKAARFVWTANASPRAAYLPALGRAFDALDALDPADKTLEKPAGNED